MCSFVFVGVVCLIVVCCAVLVLLVCCRLFVLLVCWCMLIAICGVGGCVVRVACCCFVVSCVV